MRTGMRIVGAAALPLLVHCTLTTSLDGLSEGTKTAGPDSGLDGASPITEAGAVTPMGEGGTDEGGTVDAGFCPRQTVYCTDFSSGTVDDVSEDQDISAGSTLAIENGALRATMIAHPNAGFFTAQLFRGLSTEARKAILDLDIFIVRPAWDDGGNVPILAINLNGMPSHSEELYISPTNSSVTTTVDGELLYNNTKDYIATDKWVHVTLKADFTPHNGSMTVSFDGVIQATHAGIDFQVSTDAELGLVLGLARNNEPTPAFDVRYDNVVLQLP